MIDEVKLELLLKQLKLSKEVKTTTTTTTKKPKMVSAPEAMVKENSSIPIFDKSG